MTQTPRLSNEREAERSHSEALRSDFTETASRIRITVANEEHAGSLARRLLAGDYGESSAELDQMLFDLWSLPTLEPVAGALDEIISSGQLRIIRNDPLRSALAAWPADVEHYRRRESWAQDNWNFFVAPYLMREFSASSRSASWVRFRATDLTRTMRPC